jgi:hypothetical protein
MLLRTGEHRSADRIVDQLDRVTIPAPLDERFESILAGREAADHCLNTIALGTDGLQGCGQTPAIQIQLDLVLQTRRHAHFDAGIAA